MKKFFKELGLVLLVFLIVTGVQLIIGGVLGAMTVLNDKFNPMDWVLILPNLVLIILFMIYNKVGHKEHFKQHVNKKDLMYSFLIGATYTGIGVGFTQLLQRLIGGAYDTSMSNEYVKQLTGMLESMNLVALFIGVAIFAPIAEEFFFRGILFERSKNIVSPKTAAVVSALAFGLIHFNILQGSNAFILGLLFAYIYHNTGTIYAPILAHLGNNFVALVIGNILEVSPIIGFSLMGINVILFIILFYKFHKKHKNKA